MKKNDGFLKHWNMSDGTIKYIFCRINRLRYEYLDKKHTSISKSGLATTFKILTEGPHQYNLFHSSITSFIHFIPTCRCRRWCWYACSALAMVCWASLRLLDLILKRSRRLICIHSSHTSPQRENEKTKRWCMEPCLAKIFFWGKWVGFLLMTQHLGCHFSKNQNEI